MALLGYNATSGTRTSIAATCDCPHVTAGGTCLLSGHVGCLQSESSSGTHRSLSVVLIRCGVMLCRVQPLPPVLLCMSWDNALRSAV